MIIGLGSGRCGTTSLTNLLNFQKDSFFSHEMIPHLNWNFQTLEINTRLEELSKYPAKNSGDVSCYYLNYVTYINSVLPDTKFICLFREREKVVTSFSNHCIKRDFWTNNPNREHSPVEVSFPKYPITDKKIAIGMYWDEYYKKASELAKKLSNFRIFHITELNSTRGVKEILDFAGFDKSDQVIRTNVRVLKQQMNIVSGEWMNDRIERLSL